MEGQAAGDELEQLDHRLGIARDRHRGLQHATTGPHVTVLSPSIQAARELLILSKARGNQILKVLARARQRRAKRDDGSQRVLEAGLLTVAPIASRHLRQIVSLVDGKESARKYMVRSSR